MRPAEGRTIDGKAYEDDTPLLPASDVVDEQMPTPVLLAWAGHDLASVALGHRPGAVLHRLHRSGVLRGDAHGIARAGPPWGR